MWKNRQTKESAITYHKIFIAIIKIFLTAVKLRQNKFFFGLVMIIKSLLRIDNYKHYLFFIWLSLENFELFLKTYQITKIN